MEQHERRIRQRARANPHTPAAQTNDESAPGRSAVPAPTRHERDGSRSKGRASSLGKGARRWASYTEPRQVSEVLRRIMADATPQDVRQLAQKQGLEVSRLVDDVVYASAPAPSSHPLISAKWLVELRFDGGRLGDIRVRRGLSGP